MPTQAKLFVGFVIAAGAVVLLLTCLIGDHELTQPSHFLQCLILALLASTFKIRLPGINNSIAANFVLFLIAVDRLRFDEVLILAFLSCLLQCVWRPRTKPKAVQVLFSLGSTTISIALAFELTSGLRAVGAVLPELMLASAVFFVVNSALTSAVVAMVRDQPILEIWRNCHRWAFPYHLIGSILAVAITVTTSISGWPAALAMLPLMYLVYLCYGQWVGSKSARESVRAQ